jgi:phosphatidylethanolamine/phosphatidyl-N-methylethanolamine N-methyltransferase
MELEAVSKTYARWAPFYDWTFGFMLTSARKRTIALANAAGGSLLEVGVGTGLTLPLYADSVAVSGFDYSGEMLEKARERVARHGLTNVRSLLKMDARHIEFPDASFDQVVAMHVLSVVPEPERVMGEIERVLKPGGQVIILGHFADGGGLLGLTERLLKPFANRIGWHSDFERAQVLGAASLSLESERRLSPFGIMTLMVLRKRG